MSDANLVLLNGQVATLELSKPWAEAVAIRCNRICLVGSNEDVKRTVGSQTKVVDLEGKALLPGFIDSHIHPLFYGHMASAVVLSDVKNIEEFVSRIEEKIKGIPPGRVVLGFGWNQELMEEKRYPTRQDIDGISPNNPVFLSHYNMHVYLANRFLLEKKGITKDTPDPDGGKIDRDPDNGEPTGILRERALDLVAPGFMESGAGLFDLDECKDALRVALKKALEFGITTVCDAIADGASIRSYQELFKGTEQLPRVNFRVGINLLDEVIRLGFQTGFGSGRLKFGGLKVFADGSFSSRTAALVEPYSDDPGNHGILRHNEEELKEIVSKAHKAGLQVDIHAIGDLAGLSALKAIEKALKEHPMEDARFKLVHCLLVNAEEIDMLGKLGVIASIQPLFVMKGQRWVPQNVGPQRLKYAHAWKTLIDKGIICVAGTDSPVETMNPLVNIYAAVTRKDLSGYPNEGYRPEECLTVDQAVRLVTIDAAFGIFEEKQLGSIREDKIADLTILSANPFKVPPDDIKKIEVGMTIVDGEVAYVNKNWRI